MTASSMPPESPSGSTPAVPPLLAQALRPLPLLPLQIALGMLMRRILDRHPHLLDRLGPHRGKRFGIRPTDLPFAFIIQPLPADPRLEAVRTLPPGLDASISASITSLLALVEGRVDGDALMFSRQLVIEGDVEAVLALRNAIDDSGLDIVAEVAPLFGPLKEPVRRLLEAAREKMLQTSESEAGRWS